MHHQAIQPNPGTCYSVHLVFYSDFLKTTITKITSERTKYFQFPIPKKFNGSILRLWMNITRVFSTAAIPSDDDSKITAMKSIPGVQIIWKYLKCLCGARTHKSERNSAEIICLHRYQLNYIGEQCCKFHITAVAVFLYAVNLWSEDVFFCGRMTSPNTA